MAFRQRGGLPPQFPRNIYEQQQYTKCLQLGISYPPNPMDVMKLIWTMKTEAENALKNNDLQISLELYTNALFACGVCTGKPEIMAEYHKLLCNRSLVFFKMRHFKDAEHDAQEAISVCPSFLKGYWRASQAVKGGYNGIQRAMPYLIQGLRRALRGEGVKDIVAFLAEICVLILSAPDTETMRGILSDLEIPGSEHEADIAIWIRVIQQLASDDQWASISMLVMGYPVPPDCALAKVDSTCWELSNISVGALLAVVEKQDKLQEWGENLAICLLEQGSSVEDIGQRFGKPTLHYLVELSLRIESTQLLKFILEEKYSGQNEQYKNVQDSNGCTVLHVLVKSGLVNTDFGCIVLKLLLEHNCNAGIEDKSKRKPIDYLKGNDMAYSLLLKASQSAEDLRQDLEALKVLGNMALKEGKHQEALSLYDAALKISQRCKQLYKEAAILYSNRAIVFYTLKDNESALTNALAAISCDNTWHKGHWWVAKTLQTLGSYHDAFSAFMEGYLKSEATADVKVNFLTEAVILLQQIPNEHIINCYNQLRFLDGDLWPPMLVRLSKALEWKCIAFLLFGPNLDNSRFGKKVRRETIDSLCTGVAGKVSTNEVQINTVFQYLSQNNVTSCGPWLDAAIFVVYIHAGAQMLKKLATDQEADCPLHAAVRFALLTGRTSVLKEFPIQDPYSDHSSDNSLGDSAFHAVTKLRPVPESGILAKVIKVLIKKGLSCNRKDASGKLAVEYLDSDTPNYIFELFVKASKFIGIEDINHLKDEGNAMLNQGSYRKAVELYSTAIDLSRPSKASHFHLSDRELATLYGNRSKCYLKLGSYQLALKDAMESVGSDGHWYKTHLRVGKALRSLGEFGQAMKAFINAYREVVTHTEDKIRVQILVNLAITCSRIPRNILDVSKKLLDFPAGQGYFWACACQKLVSKKNWDIAAVAYFQYRVGEAKISRVAVSLKPFCDINMLKGYPWGLDMMLFFIECGSDRKTISLEAGDTYLHAIVKMTLLVAKNNSLFNYVMDKYCKRRGSDQHKLDGQGNTVLHVATLQKSVDIKKRLEIISVLLKCDVSPHIVNKDGKKAVHYLPDSETASHEALRMAMYSKETNLKQQQTAKTSQPIRKVQSSSEGSESHKPKSVQRESCLCEELLEIGIDLIGKDNVSDGYEQLTYLMLEPHKGSKHEDLVEKAISQIVLKLGETYSPEIPKCLTSLESDLYLRIVDKLASSNKWRQLDMVVRKYRTLHGGSDQLKRFASNLTVVPVIREPSLITSEDLKLLIVCNLFNSGGSLGTDNGQMALKLAVNEKHFKVVAELIKRGADTTALSVYDGDTPIHAAVSIVLEKDAPINLLEFLLDQYAKDPTTYAHLAPEQLDGNGNCIFHLVARAKYNGHVLKIIELLCKRNISSNYHNKDGKLPIDYVTKKNDRRVQYLRLARTIKPSQQHIPKSKGSRHVDLGEKIDQNKKESENDNDERDLDSEQLNHSVSEVTKLLSVREKRKRNIEDMIRHLPDSKFSIFNVVNSFNKIVVGVEADNMDNDLPETKVLQLQEPTHLEKVHIGKNVNENCNAPSATSNADHGELINSCEDILHKHHTDKQGEVSMTDHIETAGNVLKDVNFESMQNTDDQLQDKVERVSDMAIVLKVSEEDLDNKINKTETSVVAQVIGDRLNGSNGEVLQQDVGGVLKDIEEMIDSSGDEEYEADVEEDEEFELDVQVFDNLEWEVECTAEVWKTLRDKRIVPDIKRRIVHKIQLLASGDWQPHLCTKLKHVPTTLKLFEAKFSKGSRVLWELAIAFSPRCSETADLRLQVNREEMSQSIKGGRIYSEIIRVWEIVLDHDKLHRCVQRIKKSHLRGESCIIQKNLRGLKTDTEQGSLVAGKRYPILFAEEDISTKEMELHQQEMQRYFPPASSNDSEYHILKFYTFSSILVSHVLQNIETKVDFPFRVTDLEHAIINLKSKAPILLLGRSGTGKTTCCMYRLWSQFHTYWSKAKEANARLLPRSVFRQLKEDEDNLEDSDEDDSDTQDECLEESSTSEFHNEEDIETTDEIKNTYDHLHQIFITKNAVLCNEVQKNFCELSHADELMVEHVQHEDDVLPSQLQDVHEYSFPLFLTSRQLLLMLDASLGPPHFFERKDDGSLKVDIAGWTDMDGPLSFLPLLDEDSDAEEEMEFIEEDLNEMEAGETTTTKKLKRDPRREITYAVFVDEVWPKIKKAVHTSYHPSLIWMEIMSFIKGSYEALSKPHGHLQKSEYIKLGKKRAPNFSGERDEIYNLFVRYEHFRKQNQLFDETDLVYNVFFRLRKLVTRPWVIHQIFVDETQDFTQAELCLLLRLCQNPNDMFLTGDTAQSIMRGISFRFSDLRSLFFHARQSMQAMGKTSAVEVPKQIYQLTHNYRSHAGILSLATSVLELMVEFFPESFDRLQPDQGLFHGPQPILLESCSFSDLAVLLQGNKRKTSHIEFGAHQAILVVNDNARDNIPEELRLGLILTIYEAKGLEFDDVLLYNFFKDSQASKEWRVVTEFLERLAAQQKETTIHHHQSLVKIDADILEKQGRPRPLNFDANQHKVLNSELKHLYTALTRARVNVWIFDEDMDKRAPMFEYFKARQLVKWLHVKEINETSLSETMFAEKSSNADWLRRGEDFMRHALYNVAAKCFKMGGDKEKQKVALAHGQALRASRMQDNPRQMRDEFMCAAELYMECNRPSKAAICLQNAKERELAAGLFEKLGQFERAADMYRKMKLPMASSRCYEQLGNFNKAVEVLYENENYDMAIDTLKRYCIMIQDLKQNESSIPQQLIDNAPEAFYTEEKLSHKSAELFHRFKNEERMLDAVEKFENINDKVEFLKKRGYIRHGAKILQDAGQLENAANMLLMYGYIDEAENMARGTLNEAVIAQCLLVKCRVLMSKKNMPTDKSTLVSCLNESMEMFQTCKNNDGVGMVNLLLAKCHSPNVEHIKHAWKAFKNLETFFNEAGMIECAEWLVQYGDVEMPFILECIIQSVQYVFNICNALLEPNTASNLQKVQKIHSFYGLSPQSQDKLAVYPKEKPPCLNMIRNMFKTKSERKSSLIEFNKTQVHENIVAFLLNRSKQWIEKAKGTLNKLRDMTTVCGNVQAGLECPGFGSVDNPCLKLHVPQTQDHFTKLIRIDLLFIELESHIQKGIAFFMKNIFPSKIVDLANDILEQFTCYNSHRLEKYQTCKYLWDDIMPAAGHSMLFGNSRLFINYLQNNDKAITYLRQWLLDKWSKAVEGHHDKALKCAAVRETEIFLVFEFGYHLFGFDKGQKKLDRPPSVEMTRLETRLDKEIAYKGSKFKKKAYTLMIAEEEKRTLSVQCVARRFTDAYTYISSNNPDPFEAVFKFNKFMILLDKRSNVTFFPEMKHYLMWVEFYTTLAIFLMAKIKTQTFKEFLFILPSNFLTLVNFVQETFPNSAKKYSVAAIVDWWKSFPRCEERLSDRLKFIVFGVSGHGQAINIANELIKSCSRDPTNYVLIERLWILAMVLVCNCGKAVPVECEISLMRSMCALKMPEEAPQRLKSVQSELQQTQGVTGVAHILTELLKLRQREEKLLVCKWKSGERNNIVFEELQNLSLFSEKFLNPKTLDTIHNIGNVTDTQAGPIVVHMEESDLTEEEIRKGKIDKEVQLKEAWNTERRAASVIIAFFKSVMARKKQRNMQKENKNTIEQLFDAVEVDNEMCGICGVYFKQKPKEKSELDNQILIGDKSLLNKQNTSIDISGKKSDSAQNSDGSAQNDADGVQNQPSIWEISQETTNNVAIEKEQLSHIRQAHLAKWSHLDKCTEFERFRKHFREDISPKLQIVKDFLYSSAYGLTDANYREKNYDHHLMDIERMIRLCSLTEKELQMLVYNRTWSVTAGTINQYVGELMTDFRTVQPYVEAVQIRLKQEEEERLKLTYTATTAANAVGGDISEDELQEIEPVVKEPEIKRSYKQKFYRNMNYRQERERDYRPKKKLNIGPRYYRHLAAAGNI